MSTSVDGSGVGVAKVAWRTRWVDASCELKLWPLGRRISLLVGEVEFVRLFLLAGGLGIDIGLGLGDAGVET